MVHPRPTPYMPACSLIRPSLILFLTLSVLLLGCGAQHAAGNGQTTLAIWYGTDDPVERAWSQHLARSFEASHPKVSVHLIDYSYEDLNTKLQLALSAGDPPDLAYVTPRGPGIPAYLATHQLRDLTSAANQNGWSARLQSGLLARYNRPFAQYGATAGHVMAVPTSLAAVGILYNKRLLSRLHLAVPTSLAAFEAALPRAKAAGYVPLGMGNADGWLGDDWYLTLVNAFVPAVTLQSEQRLSPDFSFARPPYIRAGRLIHSWAQSGYFTRDFGGIDAQEGMDLFFGGKTLFQLVSSSQNSQIMQDEARTQLPIGIFAFPGQGADGVMPQSGYEGWIVPAAAKHPATAVSFITHLLTPNTARFLLTQGLLPAHNLRQDGLLQARHLGAHPWQREYLQALATAQPGVYIDAAPIANLNATMEANVQLLLQGYEEPSFLVTSLQDVYASHGSHGSSARIDGEF